MSAGALYVSGGIPGSPTTVQSQAKISGNGAFGTVALNNGSIVAPGASIGVLHSQSVAWDGGVYEWEVADGSGSAAMGVGYDTIMVTGSLTVSPAHPMTIRVHSLGADGLSGPLANFSPTVSRVWTLIHTTGGIQGVPGSTINVDASGFMNSLQGGSFSVESTGSDLNLRFSPPAPEITSVSAVPTFSSVTLSQTVLANSSATTVHFEYGLTPAFGLSTASQTIPAGTSPVTLTFQINGFPIHTKYYYRAVAVSSAGSDTRSDSFTTLNTTPTLTVAIPSFTVSEGASISNSGTYGDGDGDVVALTASYGTITKGPSGTWNWTGLAQDVPSKNVTITADDGFFGVKSATFNVTTSNLDPVLQSIRVGGVTVLPNPGNPGTFSITAREDIDQPITFIGFDPGGDPLTILYSFDQPTSVPGAGALKFVSATANELSYTYRSYTNASSGDTLNLQVLDKDNGKSPVYKIFISVTQTPDPSGISITGSNNAVNEGSTLTVSGIIYDPDTMDSVSMRAFVVGGDGTSLGTFSLPPRDRLWSGLWTWTYKLPDGLATPQPTTIRFTSADPYTSTNAEYTVSIKNVAPTATPKSVSTRKSTAVDILLKGTDPGNDALTFALNTSPAHGLISGEPPNLHYTPTPGYVGSDSFTFTATDKDGAVSPPASISLTIADANLAGSVSRSSASVSANEGSPAQNTGSYSDPEGSETVTLSASVGTVNKNANGTWSWNFTPEEGPDDSQTVTITSFDGQNTLTTTFELVVNNLPPTALAQQVSTDEDTPFSITLSGNDPGGDELSFEITDSPKHGHLDGVPPALTYTPDPAFSGNDSFQFRAVEVGDASSQSAPATVNIAVAAINDPVTLDVAHPSITVNEGEEARNSGTFGNEEGNALVSLTASLGTLTRNSVDGTWEWTFTTGASNGQSQTITISANDGTGPVTRTFELVVHNLPPTATGQNLATQEDSPLLIHLIGCDPGSAELTLVVTADPAHGELSGAWPDVTYVPAANFSGHDSFTFKVKDSGNVESEQATVDIFVVAANDSPEPMGDVVPRLNNTRIAKVLKSALLANDVDADGDPLSILAVGSPTPVGATVAILGNFVVYTAPAIDAGNGSFTYTVTDGVEEVVATVNVMQMAPPNDFGPNATDIRITGGNIVVTFIGAAGQTYRLQRTEDLTPPIGWEEFDPPLTAAAPNNGVFSFTVPNSNAGGQFFRAINQ